MHSRSSCLKAVLYHQIFRTYYGATESAFKVLPLRFSHTRALKAQNAKIPFGTLTVMRFFVCNDATAEAKSD